MLTKSQKTRIISLLEDYRHFIIDEFKLACSEIDSNENMFAFNVFVNKSYRESLLCIGITTQPKIRLLVVEQLPEDRKVRLYFEQSEVDSLVDIVHNDSSVIMKEVSSYLMRFWKASLN